MFTIIVKNITIIGSTFSGSATEAGGDDAAATAGNQWAAKSGA